MAFKVSYGGARASDMHPDDDHEGDIDGVCQEINKEYIFLDYLHIFFISSKLLFDSPHAII